MRRTKVIDDEADYFAADSNRWLSAKEKDALNKREAQLRKERHGSRRDRKITFDFAGRQIVDAQSDSANSMYDINDEVVQQVYYGGQSTETPRTDQRGSKESGIVNPHIVQAAPLVSCTIVVGSPSIWKVLVSLITSGLFYLFAIHVCHISSLFQLIYVYYP